MTDTESMRAMKTQILNAAEVEQAVEALRRGELVGVPTETVYGLAGLAHDAAAVARIFEAKERPSFDPLIVHTFPIANLQELEARSIISTERLSSAQQAVLERLITSAWPGPLTLILPKHPSIPDLVTSGLSDVAVRIPKHPLFQHLLTRLARPLAAPSANRFGRISPTEAHHVVEELDGRIGWVLDGGRCEIGVESSVVKVEPSGALTLLRPGFWGREELTALTGESVQQAEDEERPTGPGMTASHYAPRTPLQLTPHGSLPGAAQGVFRIAFDRADAEATLTPRADLCEAAQNLFRILREADDARAELIVAEALPANLAERSLGAAIMDRLRRAAAK